MNHYVSIQLQTTYDTYSNFLYKFASIFVVCSETSIYRVAFNEGSG